MSKISRVHTVRLPLRKLCSTLPAVALIGGAIMLPASAASTSGSGIGLASENSPAVVVPGTEPTLPSSSVGSDGPSPEHSPRAPASRPPVSLLPAGALPGSSSPVTLDSVGIPVQALEGYRTAAALITSADPSCHLDWSLVGAIGRVESDHGRDGGNQLDVTGTAQPGIIGIPLDGSNGTARITDTDQGRLDHDTVFDRAVGPMQFIPGTWASAGVDANGDGVKDPQNMADAATATSAYLCSGGGDLRRPSDLRSAILRYNPSDSYVSMVIAIADAYRHGVRALPASDISPARPRTAVSPTTAAAGAPTTSATGQPAAPSSAAAKAAATAKAQALAKAKATATAASKKAPSKPAITPQPLPTSVPAVTQVPSNPGPGSPTTSTTAPPQPTSSTPTPSPTGTCVPIPSSTSPAPSSTPSAAISPQPTQTCLPACAPTASPTSSAAPTPAQTCLPPCPASPASPASPAPTGSTSAAPGPACLTPSASTPSSKTTP